MNVQPSGAFVPGIAPLQRIDLGDIVACRRPPDDLIARCEAVTIHCDKANVRGAAVPRWLGYRLDRVEPQAVSAPAESGLLMVWTKSSTAETVRS